MHSVPSPLLPADPAGSTGPLGWGPAKLVWLSSSPSLILDDGLVSGDARFLVADATSGVVSALQADGSAIAAEDIGPSNCGGAQVNSLFHDLLFSTASTWVSAAEPSRAIPGLPFDAVALSFDGTQSLATAQTINGQLAGAPIIKPVGDPPAPRSGYATAYSRAAGGVFVAGGASVADHSTLHDVWFQPVGGPWSDVTPHGGAAELGVIDAITYSYDDQKMWIVDELAPTNLDGILSRTERYVTGDGCGFPLPAERARISYSLDRRQRGRYGPAVLLHEPGLRRALDRVGVPQRHALRLPDRARSAQVPGVWRHAPRHLSEGPPFWEAHAELPRNYTFARQDGVYTLTYRLAANPSATCPMRSPASARRSGETG